MNQRTLMGLIIGTCAVLLLLGFVFSARVTNSIDNAAQQEATQQSPVPTPAALRPAKAATAKTAATHG